MESPSAERPPKRRGRPLKANSAGNAPLEQKRARGRKAQQAFQRRKEDATNALIQRVAQLERVLEQMSANTADFTRDVLHSNPEMLHVCHDVLRTSLSLAQEASLDDRHPPAPPATGASPATLPPPEAMPSTHREAVDPGISVRVDDASPEPLATVATEPTRQRTGDPLPWTPGPSHLWLWGQEAHDTSSSDDAASTGSMTVVPPSDVLYLAGHPQTRPPGFAHLLDGLHAFDMSIPATLDTRHTIGGPAFSDNLLWRVHLTAFGSVQGNAARPTTLARSIFRYLSLHLNWDDISRHVLYTVISSMHATGSVRRQRLAEPLSSTNRNSGQVVKPITVPMSEYRSGLLGALKRTMDEHGESWDEFITAAGVQEYLESRGAFYFDYDVIKMLVPRPQFDAGRGLRNVPLDNSHTDAAPPHAAAYPAADQGPPPAWPLDHTSSLSQAGHASDQMLVILSSPALVNQLVQRAICLGYTVGFPTAELDHAIAEAAISLGS